MPTLMLVDGNSLTYRAFHALPPDLATSSGQLTNAVLGFTSMLINLVRDHRPDHVAVTFDRPERTFRHEMVPTYKATREAAPDILRQQMGLVRQVVEQLGIPIIEQAGVEADDIIATLATQAEAAGTSAGTSSVAAVGAATAESTASAAGVSSATAVGGATSASAATQMTSASQRAASSAGVAKASQPSSRASAEGRESMISTVVRLSASPGARCAARSIGRPRRSRHAATDCPDRRRSAGSSAATR